MNMCGAKKILQYLLFVLILAIIWFVFNRAHLYTVADAVQMGLLAIAGLGLVLLTGFARQLSLGQAAFYGLGAYSSAITTTKYAWHPFFGWLLGVVLCGCLAYLAGRLIFRIRGHYLALATLALGLVTESIAQHLKITGGVGGLSGIPKLAIGGHVFSNDTDYFALAAFVLIVFTALTDLMINSHVGRRLIAIGDSEPAAAAFGVNLNRSKAFVFLLSGVAASTAGTLYAHWVTYVDPSTMNFMLSIEFLIVVVIGGLKSVWGPPVGAFVVVSLGQWMQIRLPELMPTVSGDVEILGYGIALALILLFLPRGLAPACGELLSRLIRRLLGQHGQVEKTAAQVPSHAIVAEETRAILHGENNSRLVVEQLCRSFGGVQAVWQASFAFEPGTINGIIGPNGAGKTTLLNMLSGVTQPSSGTIVFGTERLAGKRPDQIFRIGIARTFQDLQLFKSLTVRQNVMIPLDQRGRRDSTGSRASARSAANMEQTVERLLALVGMTGRADQVVDSLAYPDQRRTEIARALAGAPDLLLLDEPLAGMSGPERQEIGAIIRAVADRGVTVALVEHDVRAVMTLCEHIVVLDSGRVIAKGTPDEIRNSPVVIESYLGTPAGMAA